MLDKAPNGYIMSCDNCPNSIHITYATTFKEAYAEAKESGWINRQINNEWNNFCSKECYQDKKEETKCQQD